MQRTLSFPILLTKASHGDGSRAMEIGYPLHRGNMLLDDRPVAGVQGPLGGNHNGPLVLLETFEKEHCLFDRDLTTLQAIQDGQAGSFH